MVHPVTYTALYSGIISVAVMLAVAELAGFTTVRERFTLGDDATSLTALVLSLLVVAWFFPTGVNQVYELQTCFFTRIPHSVLGGLLYGVPTSLLVTGLYVATGGVDISDRRTLGTLVVFFVCYGGVLGLVHGTIYPIVWLSVPSTCPPLL